jgi:hypothetical protein
MALYYQQLPRKSCFAWDLNMNSLSRFEFGESRKDQKNILAIEYCRFGPTTQKKTHHNTPSWSRLPYMESVNKQAKDGEYYHNILASMCAA